MKTLFLNLLFAASVSLMMLTGCGEKSKKDLKEANDKMKEANIDLIDATKAASSESAAKLDHEWKTFKHETDSTITGMEKNIKKLNEKISKAGKTEQKQMRSKIKDLNEKLNLQKHKLAQEDQKMQTGLKNFDQSIAAKNESFRKEFKHDMHELGTALKDLFTDNVK